MLTFAGVGGRGEDREGGSGGSGHCYVFVCTVCTYVCRCLACRRVLTNISVQCTLYTRMLVEAVLVEGFTETVLFNVPGTQI